MWLGAVGVFTLWQKLLQAKTHSSEGACPAGRVSRLPGTVLASRAVATEAQVNLCGRESWVGRQRMGSRMAGPQRLCVGRTPVSHSQQPTAPGNSVYLLQMCCRQSLMLAVSGRTGVVFAAEDAAYLSPDATHLSRRTRRICVRIRGRNSV